MFLFLELIACAPSSEKFQSLLLCTMLYVQTSYDENSNNGQVLAVWSVMIDAYTESPPPTPSGWK